jgi:hypothetical protein
VSDEYIKKRLEGEYNLQTEKLRNLLRTIYRDENQAWDKWQKLSEKHRFDVFLSKFHKNPKVLGKLQGKVRFGFLPNEAHQDRERALREVKFVSERWWSAQMQLHQTDARAAEQKQQQKIQTKEAGQVRPQVQQKQQGRSR